MLNRRRFWTVFSTVFETEPELMLVHSSERSEVILRQHARHAIIQVCDCSGKDEEFAVLQRFRCGFLQRLRFNIELFHQLALNNRIGPKPCQEGMCPAHSPIHRLLSVHGSSRRGIKSVILVPHVIDTGIMMSAERVRSGKGNHGTLGEESVDNLYYF